MTSLFSISKVIFLIFSFTCFLYSQESSKEASENCKKRAKEITSKFEESDPIRRSVENGWTGKCIRYSWMDSMDNFGIKRAMFLVNYSWNRKRQKIKIKGFTYQKEYFSKNIEDKKLLKQIKESGLDEELKQVVINQVKTSKLIEKYSEESKSGNEEFQVDLLSDESLPATWWIF